MSFEPRGETLLRAGAGAVGAHDVQRTSVGGCLVVFSLEGGHFEGKEREKEGDFDVATRRVMMCAGLSGSESTSKSASLI